MNDKTKGIIFGIILAIIVIAISVALTIYFIYNFQPEFIRELYPKDDCFVKLNW